MKTRKFFSVFALVVFGSIVLASCNDDSTAEDENLYDTELIKNSVKKEKIVRGSAG